MAPTSFPRALAALLAVTALAAADLIPWDSWAHQRVALRDVSIHLRYAGSGPPLLLVHGNPQHSLTWRVIGPILAQNYTVIAPDNRGAGDSSIPPDGDYGAEATAEDLKGVLDFLNITSAHVVSHDKGVGFAAALAASHPSYVKRLVMAEYILPGFGYEAFSAPAPYWDLYANWQLAFFSVPDAAEFFIRGRERDMLLWYFFHGSYSGPESFPAEIVDAYAGSISKPGFLRAMLGPFATQTVTADAAFFNSTLGSSPSRIRALLLGGEASTGDLIGDGFRATFPDIEVDVVPKAGHWIADENPVWVAKRVARFLGEETDQPPVVDLSGLADRVTLTVGAYGTLRNYELAMQMQS